MILEEFNTDQVNTKLEENEGWLLLDFHAEWCGPCKRMTTVLEGLDDAHSDVLMVKVNSDDEYELAQRLEVRSIPTLFMYYRGQQIAKWEGGQDVNEINEWIQTTQKEYFNE